MTCGLPRTSVPSSIHCDHLIQASQGADTDLKVIMQSLSDVNILMNAYTAICDFQ